MEVSSHALALGRVYGIALSYGGVHQPHAGSSGLPWHDGESTSRPSVSCSCPKQAPPQRMPS